MALAMEYGDMVVNILDEVQDFLENYDIKKDYDILYADCKRLLRLMVEHGRGKKWLHHGYYWEGMRKLTTREALEAFANGEELYWLYEDNTEGLLVPEDETEESIIEKLEEGLEIGTEKADWEEV